MVRALALVVAIAAAAPAEADPFAGEAARASAASASPAAPAITRSFVLPPEPPLVPGPRVDPSVRIDPHVGVANDPFLSRAGIGLDLDLAGGVRVHAADGADTRAWLTRARAGVLLFHEPSFISLGIAGQLGPLASSSLGVELAYSEVVNGLTAQVGAFPLDSIGGTIVEGQLGWTVFAAEYQRRVSGPRDGDQAFFVVVHAPLGIIYQMLKPPPGVVRR